MIKLIRVDNRLLHGQIVTAWRAATGCDCILIVSDTVKSDPMRMQALKMAKPEGLRVVVKNRAGAVAALTSGVTDKYKLFVVCETIADADAVARATGTKEFDVGNAPFAEGREQISRSVAIDEEERAILRALDADGFRPYLQMVPSDKQVDCIEKI